MAAPAPIYDVLIAGGGPVGTALAIALADTTLSIGLVMPRAADDAAVPAPFRPIALAAPSRTMLARWGAFDDAAATPIRSIHVSQRARFGRTLIRADEHGVPALGYVVEAGALQRTLVARVRSAAILHGQVIAWSRDEGGLGPGGMHAVDIADADGVMREVRARLLVVADGGRDAATTREYDMRDYGQTGIVATVRPTAAHQYVAYERFTPDGPIALLPFGDRYAVVWSARGEQGRALAQADDRTFVARLGAAFGERVGRFSAPSERVAYPLALKRWSSPPEAGVIAIGNAAQTLHPVAGQGLNLGLRDAAQLAELVRGASHDTLASESLALRYARARAADRLATITATDVLARVFTGDSTMLALARGAGLALLDALPPARALLARRMMLGHRGIP